MANVSNETIEKLASQMRGEVITPSDSQYDNARAIWNAMIDRRPAVIVRCKGVADITRSISFAREQNLLLAIRGGAHNIAGNAICDDGLVVDLSRMNSVHVNPETRRAYVESGATLYDFDHEAQIFGLATPLGINSTTGVAGLTLGGGFGWLTRKYGLTIDNLVSAEIITAEGKRIVASEQNNPDLFWGIRGGGGNFGVVTQFEFQMHAVGPNVLCGLLVFPLSEGKTVLNQYRKFVDNMPDELSVWAVLRKAPPLPFLPADVHGKEVVVLAVCYAGDIETGKQLIEPLRGFGKLHGQHIGPNPYAAWQQTFDPLLAPGARNYWKSHNFTSLSDALIDTVLDYAGKLPSPLCEIFMGLLGGQASRISPDATAYTHRDAKFVMNVHTRWETPEDDAKCIDWARDFFKVSTPYATGGVYVNFLTEDESDRLKAAYGNNYDRLVELKKKYDPENLFRMNQNIAPSKG
ncbi:MAG: FAD-binding oxidoreductase [Pseudomonadota bacterium]